MGQTIPKTLVFICGPPAVGKMTVGLELKAITGLPLFHNHASIEAVLPVFDFGTPPFSRLVGEFRTRMFEEVVESDLPGLIFTMMWAFDLDSEQAFVEEKKAIFESRGGRTIFVELSAPLETRIARNSTDLRLAAKPSKRDVEASTRRLATNDARYQLNSNGKFPFPDHLLIDNTDVPPRRVAEEIVAHFGLPKIEVGLT